MSDFDYSRVIERILSKNRWGSEGALAKALGVTPNTWTAYKRGSQSFGLHEITKICDILEVDARWLLFGESNDVTTLVAEHVADILQSVNEKVGIKLPAEMRLKEATRLAAELINQTTDLGDAEEFDMRLKLLEKRLLKEARTAKSQPGTGKRSA